MPFNYTLMMTYTIKEMNFGVELIIDNQLCLNKIKTEPTS